MGWMVVGGWRVHGVGGGRWVVGGFMGGWVGGGVVVMGELWGGWLESSWVGEYMHPPHPGVLDMMGGWAWT